MQLATMSSRGDEAQGSAACVEDNRGLDMCLHLHVNPDSMATLKFIWECSCNFRFTALTFIFAQWQFFTDLREEAAGRRLPEVHQTPLRRGLRVDLVQTEQFEFNTRDPTTQTDLLQPAQSVIIHQLQHPDVCRKDCGGPPHTPDTNLFEPPAGGCDQSARPRTWT